MSFNINMNGHGSSDSFLEDMGLWDERQDWLDNKEAEYRMMGMPAKEAKEKAMSDWHTYQVPNE